MKQPLVSVIVPVYMVERYIGRCVESIIGQTYRELEIILVDDGGSDNSAGICDLYARKDSRVRVIHQRNGGLVSARKAGISASAGEYVACVDGDDRIAPKHIEQLCMTAENVGADAVCAGYTRELFSSCARFVNALSSGVYEGEELLQLQGQMLSCGPFYRPGITTYLWNKLFRREILLEPQMSVDDRISVGEDAAAVYPALLGCRRVVLTGHTTYHYCQRENSMLKQSANDETEVLLLRILYDYLTVWARNTDARRLTAQTEDYLLSVAVTRLGGRTLRGDYPVFGSRLSEKRVAVYSAGTFGQQLMRRLKNDGCCVVAWLDDDYREYRRCGLDVDPVESVSKIRFDVILVAAVDSFAAETVFVRLTELGVDRRKIEMVRVPENREQMIASYLGTFSNSTV